jgi:hypothetical protein
MPGERYKLYVALHRSNDVGEEAQPLEAATREFATLHEAATAFKNTQGALERSGRPKANGKVEQRARERA